jgi:hypothetical protein
MSSKFLGRTAVGIAAATATLLIATPGIASADVADTPRDGGKETPSWDAKELKRHGFNIVCIDKEEQKKRHHRGMRPVDASSGKVASGDDSVGWPANGADGGGSEESKGYEKRKKHDSSKTNKQEAEQSNVNVTLICGDENEVEQGASNNSQNTQDKALGIQANQNEVEVDLEFGRSGGDLGSLSLRGGAPEGGVDGGFGGETAPNAGLAFGGAGALAAAALGTVLIRRRTADETVA